MTPNPSHTCLQEAVAMHQAGDIDGARGIYADVVKMEPDNAEALHLLGVVAYQTGDCNTAIAMIEKAIRLNAGSAAFHHNLANALIDGGQASGVDHYRRAIALKPDYAEAHYGLGNALYRLGDARGAIHHYRIAVRLRPGLGEAVHNLAAAFEKEGDAGQMIAALRDALAATPLSVEALNHFVAAVARFGTTAEAILEYRKLLNIHPDSAEIHAALGDALRSGGNAAEALGYYQRALKHNPAFTPALNGLGTAFMELGQIQKARSCFARALAIKPDDPAACNNSGVLCKLQGNHQDAIVWYRRAIRSEPNFPEAYCNLGNVFTKQKRYGHAESCYRKAIGLRPDYIIAHSYLVRAQQHTCRWEALAVSVERLRSLADEPIRKGINKGVLPFLAFSISNDPQYNLNVSRSWCRSVFGHIKPLRQNDRSCNSSHLRRPQKKRIRIGYLSGDFKNHATAHLMRGLFKAHDRASFHITGYSYGVDDKSEYRRDIALHCDDFVDIRDVNDQTAARQIARDGIDILVELKGHTEGNRLAICAYRPAPVQVAFLGFPGTCGADFIDYLIGDAVVTPPTHESFFSEKLVILPHTYQVNDSYQHCDAPSPTRTSLGLPEDAVVFCSFNEPYKIDQEMFLIWMKILRSVPNSVLWLLETTAETEVQLKRNAAIHHVDPKRLHFSPKVAKKEHLARIRLADIGLDTRIVNGHTTTSDALWSAVPVITILGRHFASRVSASLLHSIGLPDLITDSLQQYAKLAIDLAGDRNQLSEVKRRLNRNRYTHPLFDTLNFARNLERAYRSMHATEMNGSQKTQLTIPAASTDEILK